MTRWTDRRQGDRHTCMHTMTVHATTGMRTPVQCRGFARQPLQVLLPCWRLQSFHISPVRRANDIKQGLQLRLCCAVARPCLCTKNLPACRQARTNTVKQLCALCHPQRTSSKMHGNMPQSPIEVHILFFMSPSTDPFTHLPMQVVDVANEFMAPRRNNEGNALA